MRLNDESQSKLDSSCFFSSGKYSEYYSLIVVTKLSKNAADFFSLGETYKNCPFKSETLTSLPGGGVNTASLRSAPQHHLTQVVEKREFTALQAVFLSGSGSRRVEMTHKNKGNFMF